VLLTERTCLGLIARQMILYIEHLAWTTRALLVFNGKPWEACSNNYIYIFFWLLWFSDYVMLIHNLFCVKKQNKMKALRNWTRQWQVQNTLHWLSTRNLPYTLGFWSVFFIYSPFFLFIISHFHHPITCWSWLQPITQYSLFFIQDDLDEHVDVTNSHMQVCFPIFRLAVHN